MDFFGPISTAIGWCSAVGFSVNCLRVGGVKPSVNVRRLVDWNVSILSVL